MKVFKKVFSRGRTCKKKKTKLSNFHFPFRPTYIEKEKRNFRKTISTIYRKEKRKSSFSPIYRSRDSVRHIYRKKSWAESFSDFLFITIFSERSDLSEAGVWPSPIYSGRESCDVKLVVRAVLRQKKKLHNSGGRWSCSSVFRKKEYKEKTLLTRGFYRRGIIRPLFKRLHLIIANYFKKISKNFNELLNY